MLRNAYALFALTSEVLPADTSVMYFDKARSLSTCSWNETLSLFFVVRRDLNELHLHTEQRYILHKAMRKVTGKSYKRLIKFQIACLRLAKLILIPFEKKSIFFQESMS